MAWCEEAWNSRRYSGGEIELIYIVGDTTSDVEAVVLAGATAPNTYSTSYYQKTNPEVQRLGHSSWKVTFRYAVPENEEEEQNGYEYEFDTGGATEHITAALADVAKYPSDAPPINQSINFANGHAGGIDVQVPAYNWTERRQFAFGVINDSYRYSLSRITGGVNGTAWRIFARGEVMFKGARGRYSAADGKWDIGFSFAARPNQSGLSIAGQTVSKEGWHHVQTRWREEDDAASGTVKPALQGVYVQQVIRYVNFGALGI